MRTGLNGQGQNIFWDLDYVIVVHTADKVKANGWKSWWHTDNEKR